MVDHFLPESRYSITALTEQELENPQNKIVHVKPVSFKQNSGLFVVGKNFKGLIPLGELTIYPEDEEKLANIFIRNISQLTAQIVNCFHGIFILSRKNTMYMALQNLYPGKIVSAKISHIYRQTTFVDIGAGINAILPVSEISIAYISRELIPLYFQGIDSIDVKVLEQSPKYENKFIVSYKQAFQPLSINTGDVLPGRVCKMLPDESGYIVELSPVQAGIIDIGLQPWITLTTGHIYTFRVVRVRKRDNGLLHYSLELICE